MADTYTYSEIQLIRNALKEEMVASAGPGVWGLEHDRLLEARVQTAIMADISFEDISGEVEIRDKDKT